MLTWSLDQECGRCGYGLPLLPTALKPEVNGSKPERLSSKAHSLRVWLLVLCCLVVGGGEHQFLSKLLFLVR